MFTKFSKAKVLQITNKIENLELVGFNNFKARYATVKHVLESDRYLYLKVRAVSATPQDFKVCDVCRGELKLVESDMKYFQCTGCDRQYWFPNANGDAWTRKELFTNFGTFINSPIHTNHDSWKGKDVSVGFILDGVYKDKENYVEIIHALERDAVEKKHPGLIEAIEDGLVTDTSMGCWTERCICSVCGNIATSQYDYCPHMVEKGNLILDSIVDSVFEWNEGCTFFEDSIIFTDNGNNKYSSTGYDVGADEAAKIISIIANKHKKTSFKDVINKGGLEMHIKKLGRNSVLTNSTTDEKEVENKDILESAYKDDAASEKEIKVKGNLPNSTMDDVSMIDYPVKITASVWSSLTREQQLQLKSGRGGILIIANDMREEEEIPVAVLEGQKILTDKQEEIEEEVSINDRLNSMEGMLTVIIDKLEKTEEAVDEQKEAVDEQKEAVDEQKEAVDEQKEAVDEQKEADKASFIEKDNAGGVQMRKQYEVKGDLKASSLAEAVLAGKMKVETIVKQCSSLKILAVRRELEKLAGHVKWRKIFTNAKQDIQDYGILPTGEERNRDYSRNIIKDYELQSKDSEKAFEDIIKKQDYQKGLSFAKRRNIRRNAQSLTQIKSIYENILFEGTGTTKEVLEEAIKAGVDLRGVCLTGVDLKGVNLVGMNFRKAFFTRVDFTEANLAGVDFEYAYFIGSILINANLSGAKCIGANFIDTNLSGAKCIDADLTGVYFRDVNLANVNFSGASFRSSVLSGAIFAGANLTNVNFSGATLTGADFKEAILTNAILPVGFDMQSNKRANSSIRRKAQSLTQEVKKAPVISIETELRDVLATIL